MCVCVCVCVCVYVCYEEHSGKGLEVILKTKNFYQFFLWYVNQIF